MDLSSDLRAKFMAHLDQTGDCWVWTGRKTPAGYGQFYRDGKNDFAHRIAYEMFVGPIPQGLHLDHLCRNPTCANPAHLEPVTPRVNILRGFGPAAKNARKTHCKRGHPFPEPDAKGRRRCQVCRTEMRRTKDGHYRTERDRAREVARSPIRAVAEREARRARQCAACGCSLFHKYVYGGVKQHPKPGEVVLCRPCGRSLELARSA